jgi:hypothetical protein
MRENAPFNLNQIEALKLYQSCGLFHPYTCPKCSNELFPTEDGFMCNYEPQYPVQTWALNWTTDLEKMKDMIERIREPLITCPKN